MTRPVWPPVVGQRVRTMALVSDLPIVAEVVDITDSKMFPFVLRPLSVLDGQPLHCIINRSLSEIFEE